jgi:hypothetical protein
MEFSATAFPVPVRLITCWLLLGPSVTVIVPVKAPTPVGVNVVLIVHLAFGASDAPHVFVSPKLNEGTMLAMDTLVDPVFVKLTALVLLVLPTNTFPNASLVGDTDRLCADATEIVPGIAIAQVITASATDKRENGSVARIFRNWRASVLPKRENKRALFQFVSAVAVDGRIMTNLPIDAPKLACKIEGLMTIKNGPVFVLGLSGLPAIERKCPIVDVSQPIAHPPIKGGNSMVKQDPTKLPATPHQCIGEQFQDHRIYTPALANRIIFTAL